ncbi:hypothetical protein TNCV_1887261 [Trichonephila clavipes]|nr:hypothetical protein TNCV_1887261 [Trichonephila clavipes]
MVVTKAEGTGCKSEFLPFRNGRGRNGGPPRGLKEPFWKVTRISGDTSEGFQAAGRPAIGTSICFQGCGAAKD